MSFFVMLQDQLLALRAQLIAWDLLDDVPYLLVVCATVFIAAFCLLEQGFVKRALGAGTAAFARGVLVAALTLPALLAAAHYNAYTDWRMGSFLNAYEFYHYYLGSKYHRELDYFGLYEATLLADEELSKEDGVRRKMTAAQIRDLRTLAKVDAQKVLDDKSAEIRGRFSDKRWKEFKQDVRYFKDILVPSRWQSVHGDKGYNATPIWSMVVGGGISNQMPTSNRGGMLLLAALDLILIGIAFGMVTWAFGLRAALFMIILLGASYVMRFSHFKGAYLRTDYIMALVMAACLIRKGYFVPAGILTAYSISSRVFPAVFLFGIGAKLFWDFVGALLRPLPEGRDSTPVRDFVASMSLAAGPLAGALAGYIATQYLEGIGMLEGRSWLIYAAIILTGVVAGGVGGAFLWTLLTRRLSAPYVRYFVAAAITMVALFGASVIYGDGLEMWQLYGEKIGRHNSDVSPWRVGFKYLLATDWGNGDKPMLRRAMWEGTPDRLGNKYIAYGVFLVVIGASLYFVRGLRPEQAFLYGFVPCFLMAAPTYYYYMILVVPLIYFASEIKRPMWAFGLFLMFATAIPGHWFYGALNWRQEYPTYYYHSWLFFALTVYMMVVAFFRTREAAKDERGALAEARAARFAPKSAPAAMIRPAPKPAAQPASEFLEPMAPVGGPPAPPPDVAERIDHEMDNTYTRGGWIHPTAVAALVLAVIALVFSAVVPEVLKLMDRPHLMSPWMLDNVVTPAYHLVFEGRPPIGFRALAIWPLYAVLLLFALPMAHSALRDFEREPRRWRGHFVAASAAAICYALVFYHGYIALATITGWPMGV